ncbi:MAG: DUF4743 domain-containing protein [Inquilinaceae bacterium]
MGLLRHIVRCNTADPAAFRPFLIDGARYGSVSVDLMPRLIDIADIFVRAGDGLALRPGLDGFDRRGAAMAAVVERLADKGDLPGLRGENYPVVRNWGDTPAFKIDRAAVTLFGLRAFGVHVNGFVGSGDDRTMWIGRRAPDRLVEPGKLDNLVGGGQPYGLSVAENLIKEAAEEAGLSRALALTARPVGAVVYAMAVPGGLRRDTLFLYDLELPADVTPRNRDGEVTEFLAMPVGEVAARVRDTDDFKFNVPLVLIDFLIRHGHVGPDDPDYAALAAGLRRDLL